MASAEATTSTIPSQPPISTPPESFETVPEVDCCITSAVSADDEEHELPEQLELKDFIKLKKQRDDLDKQWRQTLLEIWELARQTKTGLNDHASRLTKTAICLLSEIQTKNQQCNTQFEALLKQPKMMKLCNLASCFWSPKNDVQFCCSVFSCANKIKVGGSEMKEFRDATVGYLESYFPNLNQAHRVPSVLIICDKVKLGTKRRLDSGPTCSGRIGNLSYYSDRHLASHSQLTEKAILDITSKRKGALAVELLVEKLVSSEEELPGGMFVISNFEHQHYLRNINSNRQKITAQDGDHDIIVIHRRLGVIFFQVKGCSSESTVITKQTAVRKALEQVIMDRFVFRESNRDLEFVHKGLPVHGFAALPHLQSGDLDKLNICRNHRQNILTASDLGKLSEWLKNRVARCGFGETEVLDEDQYKIICGRYVGLVSMVSLRTYDEGIRKVGQMVEAIILTPAQDALVNETCHKFLFLTGDYGTGKSLVLAKKAQKLVEKDEKCVAFIISCSDIDNYNLCKFDKPYRSAAQLGRYVKKENNSRIRLLQFSDILKEKFDPDEWGKRMVSSEEFYDVILSYISDFVKGNPNVKTHIFLDEVLINVFVTSSPNETKRYEAWDDIESKLPEGSYCWISIGTHSYMMSKELQPNVLVPYKPLPFIWYYLKFIMRVTGRVCDLVRGIGDHTGIGFFDHSSLGHTFMGPMPLLGTLADCECPTPTTPLCLCGQTRLLSVLKKVMQKFNFKIHDVTIVMFLFHCEKYLLPLYRCFQRVVQSAFFELGIKLQWNTMYGLQIPAKDPKDSQKVISVVDQHTFIGCECQNVMFIDMFGMFQWFKAKSEWFTFIVNRCTSQYVHIIWPEKEAREHWLCFLDGYEEYCKASLDAALMENINKMLNTARGSGGQCVRRLKEKQLIQEIV